LKKLLIAVCICISFTTTLVRAQGPGKQFTLEEVMSAPFPSGLAAAPVGGSVAWVQTTKGTRNVWVAGPPEYKGRQVTNYTEDDGEELGELVWTADARAIIYTRGGDLDNFGESPNPRSATEEPKQLLWIVTLDGKPPRQLAEGHSAAVSSKSDRIVYLSNRAIWSVKVDGSEKPGFLRLRQG
jgi:hypothetical protein